MSTASKTGSEGTVMGQDGIRIAYRTSGTGDETLVLIHGFPQTGHAWDRVLPFLESRFRIVVPDLRGSGGSARPDSGYDKKTMAGDVRLVVSELGIGPVTLVGHDIGG